MAFLRAVVRHNVSRKLRVNLCDINGNCTIVRLSNPTSSVVPIALKSSHAASALGYDTELQRKSESQHPRDPLDTAFADPEASFKSKTTWEVIRAYIVYTLCSSEYLVEHNMKLMKVSKALLGDRLFKLMMKATFYGHFVAGEDQEKIKPTLERLRSFGVKPILDYSVEEDISQEEAERREVEGSVSAAGDEKSQGTLTQYHVDKTFADRRYKVKSARTYFYLNEAQCERNLETFQRCLEAVSEET